MSNSSLNRHFVCLELQTLQAGEGGHPWDDSEAPQEPAEASDGRYVLADVRAAILGWLTLDGKHVRTLSKMYAHPQLVCSP